MRLSLSERMKLRRIGRAVGRSDPRLAALLAIFARLAADEAMPGHERLGARDDEVRHIMARKLAGFTGG